MTKRMFSIRVAAAVICLLLLAAPLAQAAEGQILRPGNRGDAVSRMQQALDGLGYSLRQDGVYGPKTVGAVHAFQLRNSLRQDGIAGPVTLGKLYSGKALGYAGPTGRDTSATVSTQRDRILYLRSSKSDRDKSNVMALIPSGAKLTVLAKGDPWTKVRYDGKTGYVMTGFLRFPSTPAGSTVQPAAGQAVVATQPGRSLNLRSSMAKAGKSNIIGYLPSGTVVELLEKGGTWSKVRHGGKTGYVMSGFLRFP